MDRRAGGVRLARVDVILAVRNGAPFLGEALGSVLGQSLKDLSLIVVEDGSSDATPALLEECRDDRLVVLRTPGIGRPAARNLALQRVSAPYTAILDGDDVMESQRLELQAAFLDAASQVAVVASAVTLIDPTGNPLGRMHSPTSHAAIARRLPRKNCLVHPASMIRSEALRAAGGYREEFPAAQDYDLWLRLLDQGERFASLAAPLTRYRIHPEAVSWQDRQRQEELAALARACHRARKSGRPEPLATRERSSSAQADPSFHMEMCRFQRRNGRPGPALAHAWAALGLAPWRARAWGLLGRCLWPVAAGAKRGSRA